MKHGENAVECVLKDLNTAEKCSFGCVSGQQLKRGTQRADSFLNPNVLVKCGGYDLPLYFKIPLSSRILNRQTSNAALKPSCTAIAVVGRTKCFHPKWKFVRVSQLHTPLISNLAHLLKFL